MKWGCCRVWGLIVMMCWGNLGGALSRAEEATVSLAFENRSAEELVVATRGSGVLLRPMATIAAGETGTVSSLPGQRWVVQTRGADGGGKGQTIANYRAGSDRTQVFTIEAALLKRLPTRTFRWGKKGSAKSSQAGRGAIAVTGSALSPAQAQAMLAYHNAKRAEVGSGEVKWSTVIAGYAQERAETIARTRRFAHLPQGKNPYGENLAQGGNIPGGASFTVLSACEGWYAEKAKLPKGVTTMSMSLFNRGVGHYTQMIWSDTAEIGAGIANYEQDGMLMTVIVCCYDPPGNVMGGRLVAP